MVVAAAVVVVPLLDQPQAESVPLSSFFSSLYLSSLSALSSLSSLPSSYLLLSSLLLLPFFLVEASSLVACCDSV